MKTETETQAAPTPGPVDYQNGDISADHNHAFATIAEVYACEAEYEGMDYEGGSFSYTIDESERDANGQHLANCWNAFHAAGARLGIAPQVLAARLADGGLADIVRLTCIGENALTGLDSFLITALRLRGESEATAK